MVFHEDVVSWSKSLDSKEKLSMDIAIEALRDLGPGLGRPLVDQVKGSQFKNMKELRPLGTSLRCLFAFDSSRQAVVLVAGDKKGNWRSWYQNNISLADSRFREHQFMMNREGQ
ncbi:MAG: type II toxin-antitoxin system RelE/ParE family toxin [Rhodoluna sp.]